jgi:hypothetical protein
VTRIALVVLMVSVALWVILESDKRGYTSEGGAGVGVSEGGGDEGESVFGVGEWGRKWLRRGAGEGGGGVRCRFSIAYSSSCAWSGAV